MRAPSALVLFRRRLSVWLLILITLWGACAPVLVRAQAADAGMVGMDICTAMPGGMQSYVQAAGEDLPPDAVPAMQCPWCHLAMDVALPAWDMSTRAAAPATAMRAIDQGRPRVHSACQVLPPPRGPPPTTTL